MLRNRRISVLTDYQNKWWNLAPNCVSAWQAKGARSYDSSKVNLVNSGLYNLAEIGGGPVNWDASDGWSGFSVLSRCLDTGLSNIINVAWSAIIRVSGVSSNNTVMMGSYSSASSQLYFAFLTATGWGFSHNSNQVNSASSGSGVLAMAGTDAYVNGADIGNLGISAGLVVRSPYIGAQHYTTETQFTNGSIQAVAFYSSTITAAEVASVSAAMNAL